jgi:hypothetical protein
MNAALTNQINNNLASACQATCSSCCKKGKIFLPDQQFQAIRHWVLENSPSELGEFDARSEKFDGFYLYDQQDICQFLDKEDLCRLHTEGVKPRECFWWPLHVYKGEKENLEIRASTSCCTAFQHLPGDSPYVDVVEEESRQLGDSLIRKFRDVYPGSYSGVSLRTFSA